MDKSFECEYLSDFHSGAGCASYEFFGCHRASDGRFAFRVWAPYVSQVFLSGDFNGWSEERMEPLGDGESWEACVECEAGDEYRFVIETLDGRKLSKADPFGFRFDLYTLRSVVTEDEGKAKPLRKAKNPDGPYNIFEVNLLSWKRHSDGSYLSYDELAKSLVPYVKDMGYTHVEFMPVTEFPYDGSWGYQVTGYFSVTSRLGDAKGFRRLVEAFHKEGIGVIMDWVPGHFPKDEWGLYEFVGRPLYENPLWDRMENRGWGTRIFDFSREEVRSFLLSSACFFLERFGVDGLRVDAVASIIYLDYDRARGDFTPNKYGDNRNLEGIDFLKLLNSAVHERFPSAVTVAEESTSFDGVTRPTEWGGLGFDFKWNMGWMNDVLYYCRQDPYYRNWHHEKMTFSMMYAYSERFILPLSHDEVVHVKGSILNKMPGKYEDKFAGERLLLGYMFAHPGKKLNFMGYEIGTFSEWAYDGHIEYDELSKFEMHRAMRRFVKDLNLFYSQNPALYEKDFVPEGFEWLVVDDRYNNVFVFERRSERETVMAVASFCGVNLENYTFGCEAGSYELVLDTDKKIYGGVGFNKKRIFKAAKKPSHGKEFSITMDIPRLSCMYLKRREIYKTEDIKC